MTQIKKVKTSEGVQFYPQTHTKAVIDDNGYTAESRLGAMQDEINNLQEGVVVVGEGMTPVPSDLTPTEGSTNWVTSGGIYNAVNSISEKFNTEELHLALTNQTLQEKTIKVFTSPINFEIGNKYRIIFQLSQTASGSVNLNLRSDSSQSNPAVQIATITSSQSSTDFFYTPDAEKNYQYLSVYSNSGSYVFSVHIYKVNVLEHVPALYNELGENSNGAISQSKITDMVTVSKELFDYNTAATSLRRTTSGYAVDYIKIERIENGFRITCLKDGSNTYASIRLPNLVVGETYYLSFDYNSSGLNTTRTPYVRIDSNDTFNGTYNWGINYPRNTSGSYSGSFEAKSTTAWLSVADYDLGKADGYVEFTNISIIKKTVYENIGDTLYNLETSTSGFQAQIDALKGNNVFDISSQTTAQTDASVLSVEKTETGYRFICYSKTSNKYATASIGDMVEGNQYVLSFDYEASLPDSWNIYTGLVRMSKINSLANPDTLLLFYLTQNKGHVIKIFTAQAEKAYLRLAAYDFGANATLDISNISLCPYEGAAILDGQSKMEAEAYHCEMAKFYSGTPIPSVTKQNVLGLQPVIRPSNTYSSGSVQGCAAFDKYLFEFSNYGVVNIYDLQARTFVQQLTPTDDTGVTDTKAIHYNNAAFSTKFYDANDEFPLLYVSGESRVNTDKANVYRITRENDVFSMSLIQKISFKFTHNGSATAGFQQIYIDTVDNKMYSRLLDVGDNWYKFSIPEVVEESTPIPYVELTDSDVLNSFTTIKGDPMPSQNIQGGIIVNGMCYNVYNVPSWNQEVGLTVVDIWNKRHVCSVNLSAMGWWIEPEGLALYDGHLYMNTGGIIKSPGGTSSGNDRTGQGIWKLCF